LNVPGVVGHSGLAIILGLIAIFFPLALFMMRRRLLK
jgi:hypothetical protein